MKSKRFTALIVIASVELAMMVLFAAMNYVNGHEISFSGVAACFAALAVIKSAYDAAESYRPSGHDKEGLPLIKDEDL